MTEFNDIYRGRQTVIEMVTDRGYQVPEKYKNIQKKEFEILYNNRNIDIEAKYTSEENNNIYVKFVVDRSNLAKKDLIKIYNNIIESTGDPDIHIIIVISDDKPSNFIVKELAKPEYQNVELFLIKTLLINVTKHSSVPKHQKSNESEITKLCKFLQCERVQLGKLLAKIKVTDPPVRYYGMRVGDICRITRKSQTAGESDYYRYVIKG